MDNQIQTSFIPKQAAPVKPVVVPKKGSAFLNLVSFIVLVISLLLAAGAYTYQMQLQTEINQPCDLSQTDTKGCGLLASLAIQKSNMKESLLTEMQRFDLKLKIANAILAKHITLVPLFQLINETTLKNIRYTSFGLQDNTVTMKGTAGSYEDVAVQSKKLNADKKRFISPMFSDLDLDQKGNVIFKLTFKVDPQLLLYSDYVNSNASTTFATTTAAAPVGLPVPTATTTATSTKR
jgi:hypothetical protein